MGQEGDRGGERTIDGASTRVGGREWHQLHLVRNGLKQEEESDSYKERERDEIHMKTLH